MRALVTGVAGFIGSHLACELIKRGDSVIGIDSFTDYYPRKIKEKNIESLREEKKFSFIQADILETDLSEILSRVDCCFHQAAQAGVRKSWGKEFEIYVKCNILATQRLLEEAIRSKLPRFVYASSSSVYGTVEVLPAREDTLLNPLSPYGTTKLCAENLVSLYQQNYGLSSISLRYFTVFGPRQRPDMAFHRFIKAGLKGEEIEIYGSGKQTRDFTFISDIVSANILAAESNLCGAFNIGGGYRITLLEAVREIEKAIGKPLKIEIGAEQKGDVQDTSADITKAKKELFWSPKYDLSAGLSLQVEWMKDNLL
ncbi:MAG: GDP-mannose 4,6-dehydratase [bacterium]|nr:GDP-mannose 4,6-dehydratase [bacterium]